MELKINRKDTYNCFQNQVVAVAKYYQTDYRMMLLELWGFTYDYRQDKLGERMGLFWNGNLNYRKDLLSKFHGISFERFSDVSDIKNIENIVRNNPVAFYTDSFNCEWLPFYRKQHRQHLCNIVRIDENFFYCQDDYINTMPYIKVPRQEIEMIANDILLFSNGEKKKCSKDKIRKALAYAVDLYSETKSMQNMKMFVEDFPNDFDIDKEMPNEDPISSKVIMYLKCLGDDKQNMLDLFSFINHILQLDINTVQNILFTQSTKLYKIRNYLIKRCFGSKIIDRNLLARELKEILICEQRLYEFIMELI